MRILSSLLSRYGERKEARHLSKYFLLGYFLFTLHFALAVYINSSFLEGFISVERVGFVFTVAAVMGLVVLTQIERALVRFGDIKVMLGLGMLDAIALFGLSLGVRPEIFPFELFPAILLVVHYVTAVFLLRFALDVYFEDQMSEEDTGLERGKLLVVGNLAWLLSAFTMSRILTDGQYWRIYALSFALLLLFLGLLITKFKKREEPAYDRIYLLGTLREVWERKDILLISIISFLLQMFFAWMIIYLPIHLHEFLNMPWAVIGLLLTIMLVPYVFVEVPLGIIADTSLGEKELLVAGFIVVSIFTFPIAFLTTTNFFVWAIVLFLGRIGVATIEVMSETYFFKNVGPRDANLIGFYRSGVPAAYIVGPAAASFFLSAFGLPLPALFIILSIVMLGGLAFVLPLEDTR